MTCPAPGAAAQYAGTATYSVHFGSPTGPSTIAPSPGQTIEAFVTVSFSPGIGSVISWGSVTGPVVGLSDGCFSIIASNAGAGSWSGLTLAPPYNFPLGTSVGTPFGLNVSVVLWGLGFGWYTHPSPQNPDVVWSGTLTWNGPGPATLDFVGLVPTGLFFGSFPHYTVYNSVGVSATILPSPGATALLAFAGLTAARRRRAQGVMR